MAADRGTGRNSCGEEALLVLKENIYKYNSREEKERLDKLGQRLSEERLLSNASIRELIDLHVRYNDGESLDSIVASIKHPATLPSQDRIQTDQEQLDSDHMIRVNQSEDSYGPPSNEAGSLSAETTCKVCLDRRVQMLLFPCSHLVTCADCTVALFECPVCRAHIKGTVTTVF